MNERAPNHLSPTQSRGQVETRSQILEDCLRVLLVMTMLALLSTFLVVSGVSPAIYILGFLPFFVVYGTSLLLLRRGRSEASAWLTVLGTLVLQTFANFFNPGLEGQALVSFLNLILIAGFTLGQSAALLTTGVAALCVALYINWMGRGLLPEPLIVPSTSSLIVTTCVTITTTGGIVMVVLKHVRLALIREREALTQLQQAQRMEAIGRLSAGVAHDFNNLLTVILGGVEMAQRKKLVDEEIDEELRSIQQATMKATNLTQKMMAFQDQSAQANTVTEIRACVRGLEPVLRQSMPSRVSFTMPAAGPEVWVMAHSIDVEQIVLNLVHNARDAIEARGTVRVDLSLQDEPDAVVITVRDDGAGMSPETQSRIFDPFFTTRSGRGGHGLGLTSVYALTDRLGGQIQVESTLGVGTCFTVSLPRTQAVRQAATTNSTWPSSPPESSRPSQAGARRILLVDDNDSVREVLEILLREGGEEITSLSSGQAVLDLLADDPDFDLLISDVLMPEMDGYQLLRRIREAGLIFPAIMVSGFSPTQPSNQTALMPFMRLAKPFTHTELVATINSLLSPGPAIEKEC